MIWFMFLQDYFGRFVENRLKEEEMEGRILVSRYINDLWVG